jgi:hypothetical protein
VDGGKTFKTYNAQLTTDARYGAFPSDTTWYIAAGNWPNDNAKRSKSVFMRGAKHFPTSLLAADAEELSSGSGKRSVGPPSRAPVQVVFPRKCVIGYLSLVRRPRSVRCCYRCHKRRR